MISDEAGVFKGRTDLRFGVGPDQEIYVLNKHDGVIRKIVSVDGLLDGDADRNGQVSGMDFLAWQRNAGKSGDWSDGNFDASALVDSDDLALWQSQYSSTSPIASALSAPEPTSWALCFTALLGSNFLRRRN